MASIDEARAARIKIGRIPADHRDLRGVGIAHVERHLHLTFNLAHGRSAGAVPCAVDGVPVPVLVAVVGEVRAHAPGSGTGDIAADVDDP